jgi:hypothetical protein
MSVYDSPPTKKQKKVAVLPESKNKRRKNI